MRQCGVGAGLEALGIELTCAECAWALEPAVRGWILLARRKGDGWRACIGPWTAAMGWEGVAGDGDERLGRADGEWGRGLWEGKAYKRHSTNGESIFQGPRAARRGRLH